MAAITRAARDLRTTAAEIEDALKDARRADDQELIVYTLSMAAFMHIWSNDPERLARARKYVLEAAKIEERLPVRQLRAPLSWRPMMVLADLAMCADDLDWARRLFGEQCIRAAESGDDKALNRIIVHRADLEWRAGNVERARELATEAYEVGERNGDPQGQAGALVQLAAAQAIVGPLDDARQTLRQAAAGVFGDRVHGAFCRTVSAVIESCVGDHAAVLREIGALPEELNVGGSVNPASRLWFASGDEIEARVVLGDLKSARQRVEQLEERSRRLDWPRPLGIALRGRGLLLAAEGDLPGALEAFEASLAELEDIEAPFERGRTLLALGAVQRRAKQKRAARESLRAAVAILEELGAAPWAEKARAELARIGGRAASPDELTATERRVAALVAEGRTNREVAAALFVAPRTVEWNLTKIYGKLGVRSRSELARRLARE